MNPLSTNRRRFRKDAPGRFMSLGDTAFRRGRMSEAYRRYSEAVTALEKLWSADPTNSAVGYTLAQALTSRCYAGHRKAYHKGSSNKSGWLDRAFQDEMRAVDVMLEVAKLPVKLTDDELTGGICWAHNLALELLHKRQDHVNAERYVVAAYSMLTAQQPTESMPKTLDVSFSGIRSDIAFLRGEFDEALRLIAPVIEVEEARVAKARKRHKKLPPPAWLKQPVELRDKILAAKAAAERAQG